MLADALATLSALLATEAFLVGFFLQRVDARLDDGRSRTASAVAELRRSPAGFSGDVEEAAKVVRAARSAVREELVRAHVRLALRGIPIIALAAAYLALKSDFNNGNPWSWLRDVTLVPASWDPGRMAVGALATSTVALTIFADLRARTVYRTLRQEFREEGLEDVLDAIDETEIAGTGLGGSRTRTDSALVALRALALRWPHWAWTSGLHGDYWHYAYFDPSLLNALGRTRADALQISRAYYKQALALAPANPWFRLRYAVSLTTQAEEALAANSLTLLAEPLLGAAQLEVAAATSDARTKPAGLELGIIIKLRRLELLPSGSAFDARRLAFRRDLYRSFADGFRLPRRSEDLPFLWLSARLNHGLGGQPPASLVPLIVRALNDLARTLRVAQTDLEVFELVDDALGSVADDVFSWIRELIVRAGRPAISAKLGSEMTALADGYADPVRLRNLRNSAARLDDLYVLAQAIRCWRLMRSQKAVQARVSMLLHPVRAQPHTLSGMLAFLRDVASVAVALTIGPIVNVTVWVRQHGLRFVTWATQRL